MDDDPRVVDAPDPGAPVDLLDDAPEDPVADEPAALLGDGDDAVATEPGDGPSPKRPRFWLRRLGVVALVLLLVALSGLQVQAARVQDQTEAAETRRRIAELDEEAARIRLESVGDRVRLARSREDAAQQELDRARTDMAAKGFDEASLARVQKATAEKVIGLRAGVKKVGRDIAEQDRLQPAAAACLFDMLRALDRVDTGARGGQSSEACKTVAASPGPA
ncbi:MAG: hypothetical protein ACTHN0_10845 [Aquihabitans sp.]